MTATVVYTARIVRTLAAGRATATAVAVRDGRILAVGDVDECLAWGPAEVDDRFADHVVVPGLVEAHSHSTEGQWALMPYVGWYDRVGHDGQHLTGIQSVEALQHRLAELLAELDAAGEDPDATLIVGGFDPIFHSGERLHRQHLDAVSTDRPIFVFHASGHLATVNSALLRKYDIGPGHAASGVGLTADGEPDGELREMAALAIARDEWRALGRIVEDDRTLLAFAASARNAGVTTAADLANGLLGRPDKARRWLEATAAEDYPLRIAACPLVNPGRFSASEQVSLLGELRDASHAKLRFPGVKLVLDGSIQGFTAMVSWPGYIAGDAHGMLLMAPEQVVEIMRPFHEAGVTVHVHCNGDLAVNVVLDAVEQLLCERAWLDHRHTVQHAQLMTTAQLRRARALGMCVNFFVNHLWFWGDQHHDNTIGPERAHRLDPCGSALELGVPFTFHSDAAVTPLGQLHTMWAAVNRVTPTGRVLGPDERIPAAAALHAVTLGAAHQLRLDHLIGSIEAGKHADFAVLDDDPLGVDPARIRDIGVWGTVVGGVVHEAPRHAPNQPKNTQP